MEKQHNLNDDPISSESLRLLQQLKITIQEVIKILTDKTSGAIQAQNPRYMAHQTTMYLLEENHNLLVEINAYLQAEFTRVARSKAEEFIRAYKD